MLTLHAFELDGSAALREVLRQTPYRSIQQAVASLTVFSHPETVAQTGAHAIFPIVRDARRRGETEMRGGRLIGFDDNKSPTDAFLWANALPRRPADLQFNHVYPRSDDPDCYTNLANLCVSPAFLAKLTDTDPDIAQLLRYRVFDLYGWVPTGMPEPEAPPDYRRLEWCPTLPPTPCVKTALATQLARRVDRTTRLANAVGWLFG